MISSSKIDRTGLWRISLLLSIVGFLLCYGAFYLANKLSTENINSQELTLDIFRRKLIRKIKRPITKQKANYTEQ